MKIDLTRWNRDPKMARDLDYGTTFKAVDGRVYVVCKYDSNPSHGKYLFDVEDNNFKCIPTGMQVGEILTNAQFVAY